MTSEQRFSSKYEVAFLTGCWEWSAAYVKGAEYGKFWFDGAYVKAHRASYRMFIGPIPDDICVLHKCDNRACVNPAHLFLGTKKDNALDMLAKGRGGQHKNPPRGSKRKDSKLTVMAVLDIRARCATGESQFAVARRYSICQPTVFKIVHKQRWAHI